MVTSPHRYLAAATAAVLLLTVGSAAVGAAPAAEKPADAAIVPLDLNAADEAALEAVPGIGKATAQRIVEWRQANGPFRTVDDLLKIKGIGEKSLEKIRPYLKVASGR